MTPDGNYFLHQDELYQLAGGLTNLTEQRQNPRRQAALAEVSDDDAVVFAEVGDSPTAVINVFTDIECSYCQRLHQDVDQLMQAGIQVRYLAFPRTGISDRQTGAYTDAYKKISSVWCAEDRATALTTMKTNQQKLVRLRDQTAQGELDQLENLPASTSSMDSILSSNPQCSAPVEQQFKLGYALGVRGTPAIVLPNGELLNGYLPAEQLIERVLAANAALENQQ